jgi:hypothetical protein
LNFSQCDQIIKSGADLVSRRAGMDQLSIGYLQGSGASLMIAFLDQIEALAGLAEEEIAEFPLAPGGVTAAERLPELETELLFPLGLLGSGDAQAVGGFVDLGPLGATIE